MGKKEFVSKGGYKLKQAIEVYGLDLQGAVCLDVGCSTGGFTDCMLKNGAERVYAIDVGYGLLEYKLRIDPRVTVMERLNARHLTPDMLPEQGTFASVDVSFISLELILPPLRACLAEDAKAVALVKPQFEAPRDRVEKGGLVTDPQVHALVLRNALDHARKAGFSPQGFSAYHPGGKHNTEFLMLLHASGQEAAIDIDALLSPS